MKIVLGIGIVFGILNVIMAGLDSNWFAMMGWICASLALMGHLGMIRSIENLEKEDNGTRKEV